MTKPEKALVGRKLQKVGLYRLNGRLLGKGNFARVEEAMHTLLNTKVAIKVMDTSKIKEQYVAKHLDREARILSRLQHPSIVCLYETMRMGSMYYLVTELATGGDLCTYIKRHKTGRLDERLAQRFGRQLISALAHMHRRGIVHRDLKMENIMLDSSRENVKIVDFGLSNIWDPEAQLQTHCGSPEYAAPELFIIGKSYGPEVDLWSLGVVLYGMVTGRLPFLTPRDQSVSTQERRSHLLAQINKGLASQQRKHLNNSSGEFRNLVSRLLSPDVVGRITLEELMFHPWVLTRHKKGVKEISPTRPNSAEHATMLCRIAELVHLPHFHVETELTTNHHGPLGGMYNILTHVQCMVKNETNGVKWMPSVHRRSSSTTRCMNVQPIARPSTSYASQWLKPPSHPITSNQSPSRPKSSPSNRPPTPAAPAKLQSRKPWVENRNTGRDVWPKSGRGTFNSEPTAPVKPTIRPRSKTPSPGIIRTPSATTQANHYTSARSGQTQHSIVLEYEKFGRCCSAYTPSKRDNNMKPSSNNVYKQYSSGHISGTSSTTARPDSKEVQRQTKNCKLFKQIWHALHWNRTRSTEVKHQHLTHRSLQL